MILQGSSNPTNRMILTALSTCLFWVQPVHQTQHVQGKHQQEDSSHRAHLTPALQHHSANICFVLAVIHPAQDTGPEASVASGSVACKDLGCWG